MTGKIGIVIVNYNGRKDLEDCIASLKKQTCQSYEIIVVDNASADDSVAFLKENYPEVHVLEEKENWGFAKGNNIGMQYSMQLGTEYTMMLNSDVDLDPDMLKYLLEACNSKVACVPKMYYFSERNKFWAAGGTVHWNKGETHLRGMYEIDQGQYDQAEKIEFAPFCCILLHNDTIKAVGELDENYFMYFEDSDYCIRMADLGYEIQYVPKAKLWHKVSASSGGNDSVVYVYYMNRNKLYYMHKFKSKLKFPARIYTYLKAFTKYILWPVYKKNDKWIKTAYIDYTKGLLGRKDLAPKK